MGHQGPLSDHKRDHAQLLMSDVISSVLHNRAHVVVSDRASVLGKGRDIRRGGGLAGGVGAAFPGACPVLGPVASVTQCLTCRLPVNCGKVPIQNNGRSSVENYVPGDGVYAKIDHRCFMLWCCWEWMSDNQPTRKTSEAL